MVPTMLAENTNVEVMPPRNPGFDIVATKGDEVIKIELKTHLGSSKKVSLSYRQLVECRLAQQDSRWQLWNIENLSESNSTGPTFARFSDIPDEAINSRQLVIDLNECDPL